MELADRVPPANAADGPGENLLARFATNSAAVLVSQVINTVIASVFAVVFIRHFGREEYGIFTTVFSYLSFFSILQSLGVDTIVLREVARDRRMLDDLGAVAGLRVALSLASMAVSWCLLPLIHPTARVAGLVVLASLSTPLSWYSLYTALYITDLRMTYPNLAFGVWSLVYTAARLAMIAAGLPLEAFVLFSLVSDGATFWIARKLGERSGIHFRIRFDWPLARRLIGEAWPIALGMVFVQLLLRIDQIMLYRMRGATEVGLYAVPVRIVEFANIIPTVFVASAFPLLARLGGNPDGRRLDLATTLSFRAMSWFALPLGVVLFAYPETFLRILFGEQFVEATGTMRVLAFSPAFAFMNAIVFSRLVAVGQQRSSAALAAGAAVLNVFLNLVLIPVHGGVGAAMSTLIAYGAVPVLAMLMRESAGIGRMALRTFWRPGACAAAALATIEYSGLDLLSGAVVAIVVYLAGLVVSGEVGAEEARVLGKAIGLSKPGLRVV